jgi:uncharacterized OsmC-like protein
MVKMSVQYSGNLRCELRHESSGSLIETDAPKDNHGMGAKFSPTDLVGAALASCILTTAAIVARRDGISIDGASAEVEKIMIQDPRRIGSLPVVLTLSASIPQDYRRKLERATHACPVAKSLHPSLEISIEFRYV